MDNRDIIQMIIRNLVIWTLKASPINNRVVHSTTGREKHTTSTLKESPNNGAGALFQSANHGLHLSAGPSDAAVIKRRRFQRHLHFFADNHIIQNRDGQFAEVVSMIQKTKSSVISKNLWRMNQFYETYCNGEEKLSAC